ncbi:uncharacterized protein [Clytia hemisphaerica]|uniref:Major facilitator superfamily (MFS) profile domain-containing protein n=1 Tax=Clytia hemisphaerica TaxID=252671 RepID=A0A7M5UHB9_9CNID
MAYKSLEQWERQRSHMLVLMAFQQLMNGIEYSITYATMWLYIKSVDPLASDSKNRIFYSLIATSKFASTILFSPIIGKIMDKHRNLRTLTLFANILAVIGNLVYTFNFSIWCLLIGAFLTGFQGTTRPIGYSEVSRCYSKDEVQSKLALTAGADGVGFLIGPVLNFFFINVDIKIGSWHLNYYNAAVGFLAIVYLILIIADVIFLKDISKDLELSGERSLLLDEEEDADKEDDENLQTFEKWSIGTYVDIAIIACLTFLTAFLPYMEDIWASLLIIDIQGLTVKEMNIFFLICAISSIITMVIFIKFNFTGSTLYYLAITWILALLIQQNLTALLKIYTLSYGLTMFLWGIVGVATTQIVSMEYYYLVEILPRMVTRSRLSYWSSFRWSLYMVGCLIASLAGPYLFLYLEYEVLFVNAFVMILLIAFVFRKDSFVNPKVIIN